MAGGRFESGVKRYIRAVAVVEMYFPVDFRDTAHCCCDQCRYYLRREKSCALTKEPCEFPERYVSSHCPLQWDDRETTDKFKEENNE